VELESPVIENDLELDGTDDDATVHVPEAVPVVEYSTRYPVTEPADFVGALQLTFKASGLAVTETEFGAETFVGC
jgi:hypothetical protein